IYGNIGAPDRLDFTVIGPTVNYASRMEQMCKTLSKPVLASAAFAAASDQPLVGLGRHALRGIDAPAELFTTPEFG
ncbi:MAG: adenylate/guanylate cyclase domain-containing protein, partial [Alphaproteobacteria bacterium]